MHSVAIATLLAAAATFGSAAPSAQRRGAFYRCYNNGFKGDCSVDPCAIEWCPDYEPGTYTAVGAAAKRDPTVCAPGTGYYQVCSNGFKGCCRGDACTGSAGVCPDSDDSNVVDPRTPIPSNGGSDSGPVACETTTETANKRWVDPTVCAPGTGYFQSCSNGFRGCCKTDACTLASPVCPDSDPSDVVDPWTPISNVNGNNNGNGKSDPTVCAPGTGFFQVCANGFKGCCKTDACSNTAGLCRDADFAKRDADPTVCAPGTGFYQVCSNGFKGCCARDACSNAEGVCPEAGSPAAPAPVDSVSNAQQSGQYVDPTVCSAGTGYYQVCANGFKGCCKADACTLGYCPL